MTILLIAAVFLTGAYAMITRNTETLDRTPVGGPDLGD